MKINLTLFLILIFHSVFAQQNEGAIKTENGFLLYGNYGINSYTLNLEGEIDLTYLPLIKQNNTGFEFYTASKVDFGKDSKSILNNYMKWEVDFLENQMTTKLNVNNEISDRNGLTTNFWKYKSPVIEDERIHTPVVTTYFLDFIKKDLIYRLVYPSASGNDHEAKTILFKIADNLKFYDSDIDLNKLQKNILQGKNYYNN